MAAVPCIWVQLAQMTHVLYQRLAKAVVVQPLMFAVEQRFCYSQGHHRIIGEEGVGCEQGKVLVLDVVPFVDRAYDIAHDGTQHISSSPAAVVTVNFVPPVSAQRLLCTHGTGGLF